MSLQNLWDSAKIDTPQTATKELAPVPTGTYMATIERATLDQTKTPNQVSIWYKIRGQNEHYGRLIFANFSFNEVGAAILKKELMKLGAQADMKMDTLGTFLDSTVGKSVEVYAKHRTYPKKDGTTGDAHNVYINDVADLSKEILAAVVQADESLPF
jgi:hypothetical protein